MAWYRHVFTKIVIVAVASIALPCLVSSAHAVDYTMSITTSGSRSVNVAPRADGVGTSISADNINVQTTCRAGYNLTVSTSVNNNNLYLDGDIANNASGTFFSPASGSSTLKNSPNTWGYLTSDTTPNEDSTFSAVPALGTTATIKTPVSSTTDIDDHFNVYYGVSVANGMNTGTYKMIPDTSITPNKDGAIVYYLTMADACTSYTVHYEPTGIFNGTTVTGSGTVGDQSIKEGVATALTTDKFGNPTIGGTTYYFTGWNTAQDGSGTSYASGETVTDLAAVGQTITLYAQWTDCQGGYVCYSNNATSGVDGTMGNQSVSNTATSITLLASNFSRSGYGFAGWNTKSDYSGTFYGPQETTTFTAGKYASAGLKLYAVWVASAGSMQSDAASTCSTLTPAPTDGTADLSSVSALTDQRDNNTYAIAKLADGNCWMIENLRLDNTNSDNSTGALAQGYGTSTTYGNFSGLADPESANFINSTTANSLYYSGTQSDTASIDIGTSNYPGYRFPRYNNANTSARASSPTTNGGAMYSYGNYYTWHAVIADLTYNGTNNQSTTGTSICPAGWHLPTGGSVTASVNVTETPSTWREFYNLGYGIMGSVANDSNAGTNAYYNNTTTNSAGKTATAAFRSFPNNFLYSGLVYTSSVYNRGSNGYYWSSTAGGNYNSYSLVLDSSLVYPGTSSNGKIGGFTARCLIGS